MKQQISYKNFFINYAIFVLSLIFVFGILIYVTIVSHKSWNKNLKKSVEYVLEEYQPDIWEIGKSIRIQNPISSSCACYDARNKKSGENCRAFIIRIQTFYGPQAGVFIASERKVDFIGYSSLHGRGAVQLKNTKNARRIEYWKMRIQNLKAEELKK